MLVWAGGGGGAEALWNDDQVANRLVLGCENIRQAGMFVESGMLRPVRCMAHAASPAMKGKANILEGSGRGLPGIAQGVVVRRRRSIRRSGGVSGIR